MKLNRRRKYVSPANVIIGHGVDRMDLFESRSNEIISSTFVSLARSYTDIFTEQIDASHEGSSKLRSS